MSSQRVSGEIGSRESRILDRNSEYLGVSTLQLMENAGKAVSDEVAVRYPTKSEIVVYAGSGRNGGDGMVAARHLASRGYRVNVILVGTPSEIHDEATSVNWRAINAMSETVKIETARDSSQINASKCDVIIDALLGTGARGTLRQPIMRTVEIMNEMRCYKIAVDVPTGIDSDTGEVLGKALNANLTITFHARKPGLRIAEKHCGEVKVAGIGIPPEAGIYAGPGDVEDATAPRLPEAHKGDFGRLLVIGGSETYSGAPALVALAALRTGVDLVFVAAPEKTALSIASFSPNLITIRLAGDHLNEGNIEILKPQIERSTCTAMGPGLGTHDETIKAVTRILSIYEENRKPALIDADAIRAMGKITKKTRFPVVVTPHAGEFQVLSGHAPSSDLRTRTEEARSLATALGGTVLLKGHVDVISDGERVKLNRTGNPAMTVGGTGDVLSGVVAGLMAQGVPEFNASVAGAFINGAAGDLAVVELGDHLAPTDLIHLIPKVMKQRNKCQLASIG
ncbi:MAG: NAD(P)H-hydrate dehydratase [Candidatus Bathyarchaeia archaeon]